MWLNLLWPLRSPSKYRYRVPLLKSAVCLLDCKSDSDAFEAEETVFEPEEIVFELEVSSERKVNACIANTSGDLMFS